MSPTSGDTIETHVTCFTTEGVIAATVVATTTATTACAGACAGTFRRGRRIIIKGFVGIFFFTTAIVTTTAVLLQFSHFT